jgi:hypothetical protein
MGWISVSPDISGEIRVIPRPCPDHSPLHRRSRTTTGGKDHQARGTSVVREHRDRSFFGKIPQVSPSNGRHPPLLRASSLLHQPCTSSEMRSRIFPEIFAKIPHVVAARLTNPNPWYHCLHVGASSADVKSPPVGAEGSRWRVEPAALAFRHASEVFRVDATSWGPRALHAPESRGRSRTMPGGRDPAFLPS